MTYSKQSFCGKSWLAFIAGLLLVPILFAAQPAWADSNPCTEDAMLLDREMDKLKTMYDRSESYLAEATFFFLAVEKAIEDHERSPQLTPESTISDLIPPCIEANRKLKKALRKVVSAHARIELIANSMKDNGCETIPLDTLEELDAEAKEDIRVADEDIRILQELQASLQ